MIIPREIRQKHGEHALRIDEVETRVLATLRAFCSDNAFVFDARRKSIESLSEKIETGRFQCWSALDDLFACTVAVPLPADEEGVLEFLAQSFEQVDLKRRHSSRKPPDVFRFDSTRFVGRLRIPEGIDPKGSIYEIRFEVQIKTLFELAWSKTTHALAYKTSRIDWRALRLAASLKASVEQMDVLLSDFESAMRIFGLSPWPETEKKERIQELMLASKNDIPSELWPKDLSRFVENCYALIECLQRHEREQKKNRYLDIYRAALAEVESFIRGTPENLFPRSISLFQVVFAVLTKVYSFPSDPDPELWFPISPEMEDLFPHVKNISNRFKFV